MDEEDKQEESNPHFAKVVNYAPNEPWRTDVLVGQKGSEPHGHLSLRGSSVWYLRDEEGKVIIQNEKIVKDDEIVKENPTKKMKKKIRIWDKEDNHIFGTISVMIGGFLILSRIESIIPEGETIKWIYFGIGFLFVLLGVKLIRKS